MLSGDGNEKGPKKSVGLISKQLCTCSTLFLFISLPLFCTTTTRNFQKLPRYTFYVFLFTFFFFSLRSFSPGWPQAFCLFLTSAIKCPCFFSLRNWSPLCFSLALALSLLSTSMQTLKLSRKKESALWLLFLSLKVRETMRFTTDVKRAGA